jgi:YD repeat-containing protein
LSPSRGLTVALFLVLGVAGSGPAAAGERYEYDRAGRLVKVVYDDGSTITYTYDKNGNIVAVVTTGPTAPAQPRR